MQGDEDYTTQSLPAQALHLVLSIFRRRKVPPTRSDLVAPRGRKSVDGLTRWISEEFLPFWCALTDNTNNETKGGGGEGNNKGGGKDVESMMPSSMRMDEKGIGENPEDKEDLKDLKLVSVLTSATTTNKLRGAGRFHD